uniref:CX domain-containing protein n=1 Tax=Meloidogyne floridensis TaxID=298350 RepID=A0A915P2U0_9BILA
MLINYKIIFINLLTVLTIQQDFCICRETGNNSRIKRRLPFSHISKLFSKITGQAKVAPGAAAAIDNVDDVVVMKNGADKVDDVIGSSKNLRNMPIRGMNRRQNYRPYEPPQFNSYDAKDEVQKARSKALSGANLALASGGIAAGAWYFSGEHTSWLYYICYYIPSDLSTFCHSNNTVLLLLPSKEAWVLRGE